MTGLTYEYPAEVVLERARQSREQYERMKRLEAVVEQVARLYPQVRDTDPDDAALGHMTFGLIRQAHAALRPTEDQLVARGMEVVKQVIAKFDPCPSNEYGDTHCWHWRGSPPTHQTRTMADCCWCGLVSGFDFEDVMEGRAPRSVNPRGSVHGTARDWLEQPTKPISVSEQLRADPRFSHLHRKEEVAANMGIRELAAIIARQRDALEEAYGLLDAWVHATKSQESDADTGVGRAWSVLGKALGK